MNTRYAQEPESRRSRTRHQQNALKPKFLFLLAREAKIVYASSLKREKTISRDREHDSREIARKLIQAHETKFQINWRGLEIDITYTQNMFENVRHLQLKCEQQLPVTETGYRSHFFFSELAVESAEQAVIDWLDLEAEEKGWTTPSDGQMDIFS